MTIKLTTLTASILIAMSANGIIATPTWAAPTNATSSANNVATLTISSSQSGAMTTLDGVIQAVKQSTIAAQVPGNVLERLVKAGDEVKAGQALFRIDSRDTQAALEMRQADLNQAQAQWQNAKLNWERQQALRAQGFISAAALDGAEVQWKAAQAMLAAAQAGRNQAALAKGFTAVTAPFAGLVLNTHADVGELAAPGRPMLTMYAPGAMRAVVQVPSSQSAALKSAQKVEIWAGQAWVEATRIADLPGADPVSQTVEWRLDLPTSIKGLLPGQSVSVRWRGMTQNTSSAISVPASAVLKRGELSAVYVVRDGRFVMQSVRTGPMQGSNPVTIWSGIQSGDRIAVDAVKAGLAGATPNAQ